VQGLGFTAMARWKGVGGRRHDVCHGVEYYA